MALAGNTSPPFKWDSCDKITETKNENNSERKPLL